MSALPRALFRIVNQDDRSFNVRLVREHECYGDAEARTHEQGEPLVEFFDASCMDEDSASPLGYFTGIRCPVSTLFQTAFELGGEADRLFNESLPMWNISSENIAALQDWLLAQLSNEEKHCLQQPGYTARPRPDPAASARELPESLCAVFQEAPAAPSPAYLPPPDARHAEFRAQLLALIERLDDLEQIEPGWRGGQVAARLQLLAAKKRLLRALALLDSAREE